MFSINNGQTHPPHHIHRPLTDFVSQRVSQLKTNAMFPSNRAVELHGSLLNPGQDLFSDLFLAFGADDDGVVIACEMCFLAENICVGSSSARVGEGD